MSNDPESSLGRSSSPPNNSAHLYLRFPYGSEVKRDYRTKGWPLYKAASDGIWEAAEEIFRGDKNATCAYVTEGLETALHISALSNKVDFVTKLVDKMEPKDLAIRNAKGYNALFLAAVNGNVDIARALIGRHPALVLIHGGADNNTLPVTLAATLGNEDMVEYLYQLSCSSNQMMTQEEEAELFTTCISSDLFGFARNMITRNKELAVCYTALEVLVTKPMAGKHWDSAIYRRQFSESEIEMSDWPTIPESNSETNVDPELQGLTNNTPDQNWSNQEVLVPVNDHQHPRSAIYGRQFSRSEIEMSDRPTIPESNSEINADPELQGLTNNTPDQNRSNQDVLVPVNDHQHPRSRMKEADLLKIQAAALLECMLQHAFMDDDLSIESIADNNNNKAEQLLFHAAKLGNFHFFKRLINYYPELVWRTNCDGVSMFHVAVQNGHENIFALLNDMESVRKLVTTYIHKDTDDNMLHLAATVEPKDKLNAVTGAAFQMQEAIRWYKEVEKIVPPSYKNMKNMKGCTPAAIFDQHKKSLLEEGEKWMKATAKSCMLVAALSATVMFASAFTVPGGNDDKGRPIMLNKVCFHFFGVSNKVWFQIFSVSEVIGMLFSSTSILMFLSILTSRVNKYAFQRSLHRTLMIGILALLFSIASMVMTFSTTIILSNGNSWVSRLVLFFACVPVLFICLKHRLLVDIFNSTVVSRFRFCSNV